MMMIFFRMSQWVEKDAELIRLVRKHGPQWRIITNLLGASSASAARNRYLRIENGRRTPGIQRCRDVEWSVVVMYLFSGEGANKKKVKGLQQKADKNWEAIKFENSMKKKNSN